MSEAPSYWIKQLEEAVLAMQEIPLWGSPPDFPWDAFEKKLAESLQIEGLKLSPLSTKWRSKEELAEGLGAKPVLTPFSLAPINGKAIVALSAEDAVRLGKAALAPNALTRGFSDPHLQEGFFTFLLLTAASIANGLDAFGGLSLAHEEAAKLPEEGAVAIDIEVKAKEHRFWVRVICTQELQSSFREHFVRKRPLFSLELAKSLEMPVHLHAGSTSLTLEAWQKIKQGDLLLLDRCTYDPKTHKGSVELALDSTPLFRARLKDGGVKILDYAFYYEEEKIPMADEHDDEEFPEEESGEFLDEEKSEEFLGKEEELEDEEEFPVEGEEEAPLWKEEPSQESDALQKRIAVSEVPLTVTVEIARVSIPVEKLLELKPGNELPLPVHPEQGVHLVISGKRVAKGELIKVGETLGVRILEIGE